MQIVFDKPYTGDQILLAYANSFRQDSELTLYWQLTRSPCQIRYDVVDNLTKRRTYFKWTAVPMCKMSTGFETMQRVHDPRWGNIRAISTEPLLEDEMYNAVTLVLKGVEPEEEGLRTAAAKNLIDVVVQKFWETLILTPVKKAA